MRELSGSGRDSMSFSREFSRDCGFAVAPSRSESEETTTGNRSHHHPPHNFIGSSTVTIYHVSNTSHNCIFKFLALPSYLPIEVALKSYKQQTKKDLLVHPLASRLQDCNSTTAVLAIKFDNLTNLTVAMRDRPSGWAQPLTSSARSLPLFLVVSVWYVSILDL